MPLVKRSHRDDLGPGLERCSQRRLVILAVHPVPCVLCVPGPNAGVDIAWTYAGDEYQIVAVAEPLDGSPVPLSGAVGKAVSRKVRVNAIEARSHDLVFMLLLHEQADEDAVVLGVPDVLKQPRPDGRTLHIGVVNIEQREMLSAV